MKQFNSSKTKISQAVAALIVIMSSVTSGTLYAMSVMDDQGLSDTTGADGIRILTSASNVDLGSLYWQDTTDNATTPTQKMLKASGVSLKSQKAGDFGADIKLNAATNAGVPKLSLNIALTSPLLVTGSRLEVCDSTTICNNKSLGGFAFTAPKSTNIALTTTNGLFNQAGAATLTILLDGANAYVANNGNQLVLSDIRASINATGKIWIDATDGLRLQGDTVNLVGAAGTASLRPKAGIQMTLGLKAGDIPASTVLNPDGTYGPSTSGAKGLLQLGLSGGLTNTNIYVRGTKGDNTNTVGTVKDGTNQIGNTGIAMRLHGTLASTFSLQYGESGNTKESGTVGYVDPATAGAAPGYGLIMSNFVPFSNTGAATFDTGNIYLNLLKAAAGTTLLLPTQTALTSTGNFNDFGVANSTFNHALTYTANQDRVLLSIRGLEITGVPLTTNFYNNDTGEIKSGSPEWTAGTSASSWSLIPVLNNVNANVSLYGDSEGANGKIGFSLDASTTGTDSVAKKDTAVFVADTTTKQYLGLRNIGAFIKSQGLLQLSGTAINLSFNELFLVARGDLAAGYLPGTQPGGFKDYFAANNNDSLLGLRLKIESIASGKSTGASISLIPGSTIGFSADLDLLKSGGVGTSFVRIVDTAVDPTKSAAIGLDQISGHLKLTNGTVNFTKDSATISSTLLINPNNVIGEELLINQVNFYPAEVPTAACTPSTCGAQTLGKMVITGGQITSNLTLKPVTFNP